MDGLLWVILVVLGLVVLNGLFVAAEFAIVGVSRAALGHRAEGGHRGARRVLAVLDDPRRQDRYIAATQLGVTAASLGLGMYGEHAVADRLVLLFAWLGAAGTVTAHVVASIGAVALMTFLHVVLGEMVPKSIALSRPVGAVSFTAPMAMTTQRLFLPAVVLLEFLSNRLIRLFGIDRSQVHGSAHHTAEDIAHIVEVSRAAGGIGSESGKALAEVFDFAQQKAYDVMVPRVSLYALELGATPEQIGSVIKEEQHTRYPVYVGDLDEIVGIVHIRDLLRLLQKWKPLTRASVWPITFVPETMTLDRVLAAMRRDKTHAVVVMDEHGGTAGMLTVKDLFEEVAGSIEEGEDSLEGTSEAFRDAQGRLHVLGSLRLVELAEL
ncbi:MAG: HlyC/CorC family transporter, partial [Planctomycetes bacterium]|nr:HlyC/CorC family transporter [Planctomycetota bacterium]